MILWCAGNPINVLVYSTIRNCANKHLQYIKCHLCKCEWQRHAVQITYQDYTMCVCMCVYIYICLSVCFFMYFLIDLSIYNPRCYQEKRLKHARVGKNLSLLNGQLQKVRCVSTQKVLKMFFNFEKLFSGVKRHARSTSIQFECWYLLLIRTVMWLSYTKWVI